ncbi:MAG: hypothetical protein IJU67_03490 [Lachnospiraceae bacterium]|nr:hypothetical protein [Lachnospiraceae bacterium]
MKRIVLLTLALLLMLPAIADVDLSGLSFDELAALRDRCQLEMMAREEWQEVTVPAGIYKIGRDIPAGHWTIRLPEKHTMGTVMLSRYDALNSRGDEVDTDRTSFYSFMLLMHENSMHTGVTETDMILQPDEYIQISNGSVIFTPYTGKPDLGFK